MNNVNMTGSIPLDTRRARWMSSLALAQAGQLESYWESLSAKPQYRWLRPTECGLVMLRGRAGGTGRAFNLGEMTVTRASVVIGGPAPKTGFAYVAGRNARHAELAALFDALLQDDACRPILLRDLIAPIDAARKQAKAARGAAAAATRVDFTTMVRGDV